MVGNRLFRFIDEINVDLVSDHLGWAEEELFQSKGFHGPLPIAYAIDLLGDTLDPDKRNVLVDIIMLMIQKAETLGRLEDAGKGFEGGTILHNATRQCQPELIGHLIHVGFDPYAPNRRDMSAVAYLLTSRKDHYMASDALTALTGLERSWTFNVLCFDNPRSWREEMEDFVEIVPHPLLVTIAFVHGERMISREAVTSMMPFFPAEALFSVPLTNSMAKTLLSVAVRAGRADVIYALKQAYPDLKFDPGMYERAIREERQEIAEALDSLREA